MEQLIQGQIIGAEANRDGKSHLFDSETQSLLVEFRRRLDAVGYFQVYLTFGEGNMRFGEIELMKGRLPDPVQLLLDLFLLAKPVSETGILELLGEPIVHLLQRLSILKISQGQVSTGNLRLIYYRGYAYLFELDQNPTAYFGEDSIALATYQIPPPQGRSLDLCAGPGIQMMVAAQAADTAYGVEINPWAYQVARINLAMNNMAAKCRLFNSSFEDFFASNDDSFDLITFNPPLLPVPSGLTYPFVGDGGPDGLSVTKSILRLSAGRLNKNGSYTFIGTSLGGRNDHTFFSEQLFSIAEEMDLKCQLTIFATHPMEDGNDFYEGLLWTTTRHCGKHLDEVRQHFKDLCQTLGVSSLYGFACSMRNSAIAQDGIVDFSKVFHGGWFV